MENIMLIDANPVSLTSGLPVAPYGLEIIKSWLHDLDVNVEIINPFLYDNPCAVLSQKLKKEKPYLIGFSVRNIDDCLVFWDCSDNDVNVQTRFFLDAALDLLNVTKKIAPEAVVVLGGAAFSRLAEVCILYFNNVIGIVGPGEYTFRQIAITCSHGRDWDIASLITLPGVLLNYEGQILRSKEEYNLENEEYTPVLREKLYLDFRTEFAVRTSYGCSLSCRHCVEHKNAKGIKSRPVDNIIEELKDIRTNYPEVRNIFFADSEINLAGEDRLIEICRKIIYNALHERFNFRAYFNPKPLSSDLIKHLEQIGMTINLSLDHVNDEILHNVGKNFTKSDLCRLFINLRDSKLVINTSIIFGHPEEREETILEVIDFLSKTACVGNHKIFYSPGIRIYQSSDFSNFIDIESCHVYKDEYCNPLRPVVYCKPFGPKQLIQFVQSNTPKGMDLKPMNSYLNSIQSDDYEDEESKLLNYAYGCTQYYYKNQRSALRFFEKMISTKSAQNSPPNIKILKRLGLIYQREGRAEDALVVFKALERIHAYNNNFNFDMLSTYDHLAQLSKIQSDFESFDFYLKKYLQLKQVLTGY